MIRTLKLRWVPRFTLCNLGRINVIVGKNNCGKTSVLNRIERIANRSGKTVIHMKPQSFRPSFLRLARLARSLVACKAGILLVDEIDTGLHYSVLSEMWQMIHETAKQFDVQVFATTHSRDCIDALATICRADQFENSDVTIQRIEQGKEVAVSYSEAGIVAAVEHGVEVR